ncbi:MAG TPA: tRNA (adenosine(37)-N6)-threonylcarbamoyltransferase complex dimerization subunit type 1 TsaB, partial [Pseudonocardiaceae bacterium]|nr:tRNA (adenosine(37)-N6)-threonylcarbamoyltransferase complex dimerization subunit type 1 TsaB [Pseudonocardiaceae bacterium]
MIVLAIDTATPAVTAGVVRLDGAAVEQLAARVTVDPRAHGELLTPHIRAALADAGLGTGDVDAIVCGTGPGPFTGLRVGMVTAAALDHGLGRPVHGVCTLDAIAHDAHTSAPLLVV